MQVYDSTILKKVELKLYRFYNDMQSITLKDAFDLVNYELGGSFARPKNGLPSVSYSGVRVKASNVCMPTQDRIDKISAKMFDANDANQWREVFSQLIREMKDDEKHRFIILRYKHQLSVEQVCEKMFIHRATYYRYRTAILLKATIIADRKGILNEVV